MGIFKSIRRRRQEKKARYKAAKIQATTQAKAQAKLEKQKEKYIQKTAKQVRKLDNKEIKARRKHEEKLANTALKQIHARRFTSKNVLRYTIALRSLMPVLVPLAYRAINQFQSFMESSSARQLGVKPSRLAAHSGHSALLKARIEQLQEKNKNSSLSKGLQKDIADRLDSLSTALDNSESMSQQQMLSVHHSISTDLDRIDAEIKRDS